MARGTTRPSPPEPPGGDDTRAPYDELTDDLDLRYDPAIGTGTGEPFAPAGKVFRAWVAIPTVEPGLWRQLLAEAAGVARP